MTRDPTAQAHSLAGAIVNEGWTFDELEAQIITALLQAKREGLEEAAKYLDSWNTRTANIMAKDLRLRAKEIKNANTG